MPCVEQALAVVGADYTQRSSAIICQSFWCHNASVLTHHEQGWGLSGGAQGRHLGSSVHAVQAHEGKGKLRLLRTTKLHAGEAAGVALVRGPGTRARV